MSSYNYTTKNDQIRDQYESGFGWAVVIELWKSLRLILLLAVLGVLCGIAAASLLKESYSVKLEVTGGSVEKYEFFFSKLFSHIVATKDEDSPGVSLKYESASGISENEIIEKNLTEAVYSDSVFASSLKKSNLSSIYSPENFVNILTITKLAPTKGLEKYFAPGLSIKATFKNKEDASLFIKNYASELKNVINSNSIKQFQNIIDGKIKIKNLEFDALYKKFEIDAKNNSEYVQESIDIARIAGIVKPQIPQQMSLAVEAVSPESVDEIPPTEKIALQNAVPRYFFGYEILEQEKKQIEANAKDKTKVPSYSKFVAETSELKALSDFLSQSNLSFVDTQILPRLEKKNGPLTKIAVVFAVSLLFLLLALGVVASRVFRRKIEG